MENTAPLRPPHDDEYDAASSLLLLSESGGGFCNSTATPTISPESTHQEVPPSAAAAASSASTNKIETQERDCPGTPLPATFYPCSMCDKVFQCSQALGGHMTVHKGKAAAVDSEDHHSSASPRVHECSFCHETFDTGKALGGHMRKHFDKSELAGKAAGDGENPVDGGASTSGGKPMIDLNLPPPE